MPYLPLRLLILLLLLLLHPFLLPYIVHLELLLLFFLVHFYVALLELSICPTFFMTIIVLYALLHLLPFQVLLLLLVLVQQLPFL